MAKDTKEPREEICGRVLDLRPHDRFRTIYVCFERLGHEGLHRDKGGSYWSVPQSEKRIAHLEAENQALRAALWEQWEMNHFEHCSQEWPHPEGRRCYWPLPEVLGGNE